MSEPTQFDQHDRATLQSINEGIATIATELATRAAPAPSNAPPVVTIEGDKAVLFKALCAAQSAFKPLKKNRANDYFKSEYADLAAVLEVITGPLNENGFFVALPFGGDLYIGKTETPSVVTVCVSLLHESGGTITISGRLTISPSPVFNDADVLLGHTGDIQKIGSARTYAARYLCGFLGIAPASDDDDGNSNAARPVQRSAPPKGRTTREATRQEVEANLPESKAAAQARGREKAAKAVAEATQGTTQEAEGRPLTGETSHALAAAMSAHGVGGRAANAWLAEHHQTGAGSLTSHPRGEDIGRELLSVIQSGALSPAEGT